MGDILNYEISSKIKEWMHFAFKNYISKHITHPL